MDYPGMLYGPSAPDQGHHSTIGFHHILMISTLRVLVLAAACAIPAVCQSESIFGTVVAVADGDTVTVVDVAKEQYKIRVAGIDAPEKKQAFGARSKQSMAQMVFGKPVHIEWRKKDRYGRVIGKVFVAQEQCSKRPCPQTLDAGLAQLSRGLAWHYKKYEREQSPEDRVIYAEVEVEAQKNALGLWSETNPIAPWDFRRRK
ncbi:thermonuclease family protein [Accumulibacter sp.]|nr:thermonuclease family protein [Accumulibacter sp.]